MGFICHNSYAQDFVKKIITEAVVVAQAEGYKFDNEEVIKTIQNICREHMNGFSSMSQDRKKKAKTEIDSINGAVVNVAKKYNLKVPYNELVTNIIHAIGDGDVYNSHLV